jgi:hypothetical protein
MVHNEMVNAAEQILLQSINEVLQDNAIAAQIDLIADRVNANAALTQEVVAWEPVPLEIYRKLLPAEIRSSWVFLLRQGCVSGAERHPNSHQRVRSWRNKGDFQVWIQDRWASHFLENSFDLPLQRQWASIPVNVWHQAVVSPGEHWIVLSFHTAAENELIEERPNPVDSRGMQQRIYSPSTRSEE